MAERGVKFRHEQWKRELELTTVDRFRLGYTDTYVRASIYYQDIIPLFISQDVDALGRPTIPRSLFLNLMRGGIIDTNQSAGVSIGTKHYLIKDSYQTRLRLEELASLPLMRDRYNYLNNHLLTITCAVAWDHIIRQLLKLQQRLLMTGWETMLDEQNRIDLSRWVKVGRLIDMGLLPVRLVATAVRLTAVRMILWMQQHHPSRGQLGTKLIYFVFKTVLSLSHVNGKTRQVVYLSSATRAGQVQPISIRPTLKYRKAHA